MQMIGKKMSIWRCTQFFLMELGELSESPMAISLWDASGCSKEAKA
jgi:hypothetical protein